MARADGNIAAARFETVEPRRLFAVTATGAPLVLAASGVQAVESAAASSDTTNQFRYVTYVTPAGAGFVVPVSGTVGPGTPAVPGTPAIPPDPNVPGDPGTPATPGTPAGPPTTGTVGTAIPLTAPAGATVSNTDVAAGVPNDQFVAVYQVTTTTVTPPGPGVPGGTTIDNDVYAVVYVGGSQVAAPFRVNTTTTGNQTNCRVAMDGSGRFVVVWENTNGAALVGRRFNADGSANGGEFTVSNTGLEPDVAASPGGTFVVTWATSTQTFAETFNANGTMATPAFTVSTTDGFSEPAVGASNGRFVVAWGHGGAVRTIAAQRYNFDGTLAGAQFAPASNVTLNQNFPEVATDNAGGFAIGWAQASTGVTYDTSAFRLFNANGAPLAAENTVAGVQFGADKRVGLAYRNPQFAHVAYATAAGNALIQTFVNDAAGNGGGGTGPSGPEAAVPAGALLVDLSTGTPGVNVAIGQSGNTITVIRNGVSSNFTASNYSSIYVRGSDLGDYIKFQTTVTKPAIVYGRSGNDTIYGGSGGDSIDGGDGDNAIQANAGTDYVYGGSGNDTIFGAAGNDRLLGGPGRNVIYGENEDDVLIGGNRADALIGGNGNDSITGGDGGDYIDGVRGNDTIDGGLGDDRVNGSGGNDLVIGGLGRDTIYGGALGDTLFGSVLDDSLSGGERDIGYIDSLDTASSIFYMVTVK